jgi:hypothetical protein
LTCRHTARQVRRVSGEACGSRLDDNQILAHSVQLASRYCSGCLGQAHPRDVRARSRVLLLIGACTDGDCQACAPKTSRPPPDAAQSP